MKKISIAIHGGAGIDLNICRLFVSWLGNTFLNAFGNMVLIEFHCFSVVRKDTIIKLCYFIWQLNIKKGADFGLNNAEACNIDKELYATNYTNTHYLFK
jgi:hypothetical protein